MANTTSLNIRIDADLKRRTEAIFDELGLSLSAAITIFLKNAVRYGGLPFELRLDEPLPSLERALRDVEEGRVYGPYKTAQEAVASMLDDGDA